MIKQQRNEDMSSVIISLLLEWCLQYLKENRKQVEVEPELAVEII